MRKSAVSFGWTLALVSAPLQAQELGGGGGVDVSIWRILAALLVSVMASLGLVIALRSRGARLPSWLRWLGALARRGRIQLVETRRIASQAELSVVRCDGIEYVVLSGHGHAEVLGRRELTATEDGAEQL